MLAKDGVSASPTTETPIRLNENSMAGLRPQVSPKVPIITPPSGRVAKPTPNVASVNKRLVVVSLPGKKD